MATIVDDDDRLLVRIGYTPVSALNLPLDSLSDRLQVLQRHFSRWSTVSYAISILGVLGSVPATFGAPMSSGGPATAVWAWFIGSIMAYCIASSGTFIIQPSEA
jgi:hypothetical protein